MESAIFGLIGVVLGSVITVAKEWWFQYQKSRKDAAYLAILVCCELERYVFNCADVVGDDGLFEGQYNSRGERELQVKAPKFEPLALNVEWKSLPADLMREILDLPFKAELAKQQVAAVFNYEATPPDHEEGFEERQLQYAVLGIAASELAARLRRNADLSSASYGDWDPVQYMKERRATIERQRAERAARRLPPPPAPVVEAAETP